MSLPIKSYFNYMLPLRTTVSFESTDKSDGNIFTTFSKSLESRPAVVAGCQTHSLGPRARDFPNWSRPVLLCSATFA